MSDKAQFNGLTPEEIQDYIDIATEALVEILTERGMTVDQFRARRKQITSDEKDAIAAEREKLDGQE